MKRTFILTILGATSVMFGQIVPNGPWQTVTTPVVTTGEVITSSTTTAAGNAYWNNGTTDDGIPGNPGFNNTNTVCYNIGCFMTNSGAWNTTTFPAGVPGPNPNLGGPGLANPVYLGSNTGAAVTDFNFAGPGAAGFPMLAEVAGNNDRAWLGWYDPAFGPAAFTSANRGTVWDVVFVGSQAPGAAMTFNPSTNFGLFFFDSASPGSPLTAANNAANNALILAAIQGTGGNPGANFTQSSKNVGDTAGNQHFAVFATSAAAAGVIPADFWVGVEDNPFGGADKDYNDMIVHLRIVPEPGYFLLLSLGLGGLGIARRRLNRA